jgi:hypothetical protein
MACKDGYYVLLQLESPVGTRVSGFKIFNIFFPL